MSEENKDLESKTEVQSEKPTETDVNPENKPKIDLSEAEKVPPVYVNLDKTIYSLIQRAPFYAHFYLGCRTLWDVKGIPRAAVGFTDKRPTFIFNSRWFASIPERQREAVLEHEIDHLMYRHLRGSKKLREAYPNVSNIHELANYAQDCAINQYIEHLPEDCVTLKILSEQLGEPLEPYMNWEYYLDKIMKNDKIKAVKTFDEHGIGSETDGDSDDPMTDAAVRDAAKNAVNRSAGNVPKHLESALSSLLGGAQLSWKQILRNFITSSTANLRIGTRKKINRRFEFDAPGVKKKRELALGVCVDSSGSVNDELFKSFLTELTSIVKNVAKVVFVDADSVVQHVKVYKKGEKIDFKRSGNGGTAYQPAIDECMKHKVDAIVYFGDGDSADTPTFPGKPFLWVLPPGCTPPCDFGQVLRIGSGE